MYQAVLCLFMKFFRVTWLRCNLFLLFIARFEQSAYAASPLLALQKRIRNNAACIFRILRKVPRFGDSLPAF